MNLRSFRSLCFSLGLISTLAISQEQPTDQLLDHLPAWMGMSQWPGDLAFPAEVSRLSFFSSSRMAIYKPEGNGPFPALVLMHPCGGLARNPSMLTWAKEAVERGYVAFLVDSLSPRGVDTVCPGSGGGVPNLRGAKDALQAAEHLGRLPFVDRNRIAIAGFSWGGAIANYTSSASLSRALYGNVRFAAAVSFYPNCAPVKTSTGVPIESNIRPDIDRPLLVLLGELDDETPPARCVARLGEFKAAGAPVEWHVYPQATHCWDCRHADGVSKVVRGVWVTYRYSAEITADSLQRMFRFLEQSMRSRAQPSGQ